MLLKDTVLIEQLKKEVNYKVAL